MSLLWLLLVSVFCALTTNCEDLFAGVSGAVTARRLLVLAYKAELALNVCKRSCVQDNIFAVDRSNHKQKRNLT